MKKNILLMGLESFYIFSLLLISSVSSAAEIKNICGYYSDLPADLENRVVLPELPSDFIFPEFETPVEKFYFQVVTERSDKRLDLKSYELLVKGNTVAEVKLRSSIIKLMVPAKKYCLSGEINKSSDFEFLIISVDPK